uniref:Motile sperm domain containing 2 n=1 Tax=Esox lucius TaxID=8010 RepID=A0A6Q2X6F0_ESOLU
MKNEFDIFSWQDIQKKREETRKRFVIEYAQDSSDSYDARDMDRLWKDDVLVDSYLECSHFVMENTLKMISDSLQWRKEFKLNDINESSVQKGLLDSGMIYLHGYDKEGNKLFWFRVRLHVKDLKMLTEKKRYVAFWLESHVRREPGTPLTVIFDMSEVGLGSIDMEFIKYIINCFHVYYPKLLAKMLMYEMPWIMNAAWKMVKAMLSQEVVDTLVFVSKSEIQDHVEREHLLPSMGGTDPFKFSYPPFPDDFQNPISETGQEDDAETGEDDLETKDTLDETAWPSDAFKGTLLHISPAEELRFGLGDGEKRCLISLSNVTRNRVAFKVRTTAPEKYRVKPSNSSCGPGTGGTITVSLYGGSLCCPQDRFLIMAAEMDLSSDGGSADLAQFWKGVPKPKIMMHSSSRLEENMDRCLRWQKVLTVLVTVLTALSFSTIYTGEWPL